MSLSWQNDRQGSMYTSNTLEANWYEEQFQHSSGTNVGLRVPDRAHHETNCLAAADGRVVVGQSREKEEALSAVVQQGGTTKLEVLPCLRKAPQSSTERTMHTAEWGQGYNTTSKQELCDPSTVVEGAGTGNGVIKVQKTSMLSDATFMHTMTRRESSLPETGFGATVPRHEEAESHWSTTTGTMLAPKGPRGVEGDGTHETLGRGGFEKSKTNRLAVYPRMPPSTMPAPLRTDDFKRQVEPTQGHPSLCPPFAPERIARKTAFPEARDQYLRPGVQIWSQ